MKVYAKKMAARVSSGELRIVLLGNREAGKCSAGNIILGREEFDPDVRTLQCAKKQGEVAGRHVTVVDTPGWNDYDFALKRDSPNLLKQEIVLSVNLCPPGPHAFLLVIHEDMIFTEQERNATSNHLSLLGHGAWKHSLVLFIQETPAEERSFEFKGKMLQWLVEKCGNRYHVLNINNKNHTQVTQLLEKIEEMVARNSHAHYKIDRRILEETEERRRTDEERAQVRWREIQRKREEFNASRGQVNLPELRFVLVGYKDAGKSSVGNAILDREEFPAGQRFPICVKRQGQVAGRHVTVVEAPGWFRYCSAKYSSQITEREIMLSQGLVEGPHCILLVVRADTRFTERKKISVQQHLALLSSKVWNHTMVVFTYGDWLGDTTIDHFIESEGEHLQCIIKRCRNRYHLLNNNNASDGTQISELFEKIEEIVVESNGRCHEVDWQYLSTLKRKKKREKKTARRKHRMESVLLQTLKDQKHHLPNLRIVLLGCKTAGKTSAANTILGREDFELCKSSHSLKMEGDVAGRCITVVEAPGWWCTAHLQETPEIIKEEIRLSASLCSPSPHAFLLVIHANSAFTMHMGIAAKKHVELLGKEVWNHTMVLFTHGDWLGDTTIEEYIEGEGQHLQSLLDKCENRYHVLNNGNRTDCTQVMMLLKKIDEMTLGNQPFKVNIQYLRNREREEEDAREREMKVQAQRAHLQSLMRGVFLPESLRVVLLGCTYAGKSSSGNTILGREEFDLERRTAQCVKRQGEVAGRQVTVVEAPGWSKDTHKLTDQEIVHSISLCHPGPHAVLIVVNQSNSMKEGRRRIKRCMELLGETVWNHTMVLFTSGDCLGDIPIEQYIESEGEELKWVVEKCGNRYHVLNNHNRGDDVQVTELLEKIEEMVAGNKGCHYEMDVKSSQDLMKSVKQQNKRIDDKEMRMYKDISTLKFALGDIPHLQEVGLVLLGSKRSGKSSSGNTILGREEFDLKRSSSRCVKREGKVAGRKITLVKAPGWRTEEHVDDTYWHIREEIVHSVSLCPPGPHAFLLVLRLDSSVTEQHERIILEHMELLGKNVWDYTLILFTYGDRLGNIIIEQYIESESALQSLVEKCGNRYHVISNKDRADGIQIRELLGKIEAMVARNNGKTYIRSKIGPPHQGKLLSQRDFSGQVQNVKEHMDEKDMARSIDTPLNFGGSDHSSLDSGFLSELGSVMSEISDQSSCTQTSAQSSGYWSLTKPGLPQRIRKNKSQKKPSPEPSRPGHLEMKEANYSTLK